MAQVYDSEDLKDAEEKSAGSSHSSSTAPGKISYSSGASKHQSDSDLSTPTSPDTVGYDTSDDIPEAESSFYRNSSSSQTSKGKLRYLNLLLSTRRRKVIFGGGLTGTIIGLVFFFTLSSGPFEFIHIAQLLTQFHFSSVQSEQDNRFAKEVRFFRFTSRGQIERTRMGYLGNKFGDYYETQLNNSGLKSTYSDLFGRFNGYAIDTVSGDSPFHGLSDEDIAVKSEELFGVKPVKGSDIKGISKFATNDWVIDASKLRYTSSLKLNFGLLHAAGKNKLSSAIGARFLCMRAGCTSLLHPLTVAAGKTQTSIEEWWKARNATDELGSKPGELTPEDKTKDTSGGQIGEEIVAEETNPKTPAEITKDLSVKGAAALGFLCIARSIANEGSALKASQVQVLTRMGIESMAIGSQVESGQDVNLNQLQQYSKLLNGTDSSGKVTSWDQSRSIQANLGNPNVGREPDKTLQDVTKTATPFDFLITGAVGTALDGVCGTVGSIIQIFAGGLEGALQGLVFGAVFQASGFASDLANWLAGQAVNVDAVGEDYGNEIDYGAALAANDQSIGSGGIELSSSQANKIQGDQNIAWNERFSQQSLAYRLFNRNDSRSAISKLTGHMSPSLSQNIASLGNGLLHFSHSLSALPQLFTRTARASTGSWNYGFPIYGFSESDMDNPDVQNPYQNADYVQGLLDAGTLDSDGKTFPQKAQDCFGVTIASVPIQTSTGQQMQWDVTTAQGDSPKYGEIPADCSDSSDSDWLKVRMFIMDTEVMNSMGCYAGDDQACSDIGFGNSLSINGISTRVLAYSGVIGHWDD
jgi:hypothetical protein